MITGKRTALIGSASNPSVTFSAEGNVYTSGVINIGSFPQEFREVWYNVTTYLSGQGNYAWQVGFPAGYITDKFANACLYSNHDWSMWSLFFYSLAIGKWK